MPILIRPETDSDVAAVDDVLRSAFGDEGDDLVPLVAHLRRHPCGRDRLAWVAVDDDRVVGHTMVTRALLDAPPRLVDVALLSPLAVDPSVQRRGIGGTLVEQATTAAANAGFPAIFLEGDPAYYGRLGFAAAGPLGFRKPSLRIPDLAFQVVLLPAHEAWMTGTLVYPEPFWLHDCVGLRPA